MEQNWSEEEKAFLLHTYGEEYGPDAGPWNTSAESKYLEYRIAEFFERHFTVGENAAVCNIGIGAGGWDRYLSYRLRGGSLTSVDIDDTCCRQLALRLRNEENPNRVRVICSDVLRVEGLDGSFDLVTMVGSTRLESGLYESILHKAIDLVKPGGALYYQTLDKEEKREDFEALCIRCGMKLRDYRLDTEYRRRAQYFALMKQS